MPRDIINWLEPSQAARGRYGEPPVDNDGTTDYVEYGCTLDPDYTDDTLDVTAGYVHLWSQDTDRRYEIETYRRTSLSLVGSSVNEVYVAIDESTSSDPELSITAGTGGAPSDPHIKIGEVDTGADTKDEAFGRTQIHYGQAGTGTNPIEDLHTLQASRNVSDIGARWLVYNDGANVIGVDTTTGVEEFEDSAQNTIQGILDIIASGETIVLSGAEQYTGMSLTVSTDSVTMRAEHQRGFELVNNGGTYPITVDADNVVLENIGFNGFGNSSSEGGLVVADQATNFIGHSLRSRNFPGGDSFTFRAFNVSMYDPVSTNSETAIRLEAGSNTRPNNVKIRGGILTTNVDNATHVVHDAGDSNVIDGTDMEANATGVTGVDIADGNTSIRFISPRFESLDIAIDAGDKTNGNVPIIAPQYGNVTTKVNDPNTVTETIAETVK